MKEYVKLTENGLACNHPKVDRFWLWGGGGRDMEGVFHFMQSSTVLFKNGDRKDIEGNSGDDIIKKCNDYLNTIPE